jgi:glycosyltransferase involved in cell wall biosynthesis
LQFEIRALCKSAQIDLFHVPYQYGAPLSLSCPLVVTVHDLIPFLFRTRSWPKQLAAIPFVKLGYRASALRAEFIIADSVNTTRDVENILKVPVNRIAAIHLAAAPPFGSSDDPHSSSDLETDRLFAKYGIRAPYVVVGSAGNWRTKNLETALRALALARETFGAAFQTVVYGPEKGLNVLAKRNATFGLEIRRAGYLPGEHLAALFRHANAFLTASLYEGFGLPIVEAMACGCPVVTSNGGSLAEVAADGAQVFHPMDARGMAEAIARLVCETGERERWRTRALARASVFSWQKTAKATLDVYRKVYDLARGRDAIALQSTTASKLRGQDAR